MGLLHNGAMGLLVRRTVGGRQGGEAETGLREVLIAMGQRKGQSKCVFVSFAPQAGSAKEKVVVKHLAATTGCWPTN